MARLADERRRRRVQQADVARSMGTSQPYVVKIEKGRVDCSLSTMLLYSEAVGIRPRLLGAIIAGALAEQAVLREPPAPRIIER
jgi:predicted transcriptional regulator